MSMIDIKKIQEEAEAEIRAEQSKNAKEQLKAALREVANAERILNAAKVKVEDLKARISEGTVA